jgi:hypothetical protein
LALVDKIKKDLIHKAKVKRAYKKIQNCSSTNDDAASATTKPPIAGPNTGNVTIVRTDLSDHEACAKNQEEHRDHEEESKEEAQQQQQQELPPEPQLHPERQTMLNGDKDDGNAPEKNANGATETPRRRRSKKTKPGYFDKAMAQAKRRKAEAAERATERGRGEAEWRRKMEERERFRHAMAKARKPGRDGQRRLGRESGLLLEKVKKIVG